MSYNLPNIRTLLTQGFSNEELRRFCYDRPEFRPVDNDLADLTGTTQLIDKLLRYAERKLLMETLLTWARQTNPARYEQHQPYQDEKPSNDEDKPPTTSDPIETELPPSLSVVQQFPAPGWGTTGLACDGTHLWLTDASGTIFKIDSSGKILGSFAAPEVTPQGITWAEASFWVYTTNKSYIYQFQIAEQTTKILSSFRAPAQVVGGALAWDGQSLWYANQFNLYQLDTQGKLLYSFSVPFQVTALAWDGSHLWLARHEFPTQVALTVVNVAGESLKMVAIPLSQITGLTWATPGVLWASGQDTGGGKSVIYKMLV